MAKIVLDTMGGDLGLSTVVKGACDLSLEGNDIQIVLVGSERDILQCLKDYAHVPQKIEIVHADEVFGMCDDPRERRPNTSLYRAADWVRSGRGDALVSAGNTGAVVVCASRYFARLPKVHKAALAAVYPTEKRHGPKKDPFALLLDVGATLHVKPKDLVCFALMGSIYSQLISESPRPRVALLSNGTEPNKGAEEVVEAHRLLSNMPEVEFMGNVEGLDIPKGTADVIVCEGFLGNVALKMLEGVGEVMSDLLRRAAKKNETWRRGLGILSKELETFRSLTDWKQYGGAPILGLDQVVIKAHGRSNARAIRNAIKLANKAVEGRLISQIRSGLLDIDRV